MPTRIMKPTDPNGRPSRAASIAAIMGVALFFLAAAYVSIPPPCAGPMPDIQSGDIVRNERTGEIGRVAKVGHCGVRIKVAFDGQTFGHWYPSENFTRVPLNRGTSE